MSDQQHAEAPARVLIVDDEPDLRLVIRRHLERHAGFEVVGEANDGNEAIARAGTLQPDVVLLDMRMPDLDGRDALPRILKAAPTAMIVVLSMLPAEAEEGPMLAIGAFAYLEKHHIGPALIAQLDGLFTSFRRALLGNTVIAPAHMRPRQP